MKLFKEILFIIYATLLLSLVLNASKYKGQYMEGLAQLEQVKLERNKCQADLESAYDEIKDLRKELVFEKVE